MANVKIDCMYEACPIPLLKLARELKKLEQGDVVVVETDHSCAILNITEWAEKEKFDYWIDETNQGEWDIHVRKTRLK